MHGSLTQQARQVASMNTGLDSLSAKQAAALTGIAHASEELARLQGATAAMHSGVNASLAAQEELKAQERALAAELGRLKQEHAEHAAGAARAWQVRAIDAVHA